MLEYDTLIKSIVLKFKIRPSSFEDAVQEGYLGLLKCQKKFDGRVKFSTYAYKAIYWQILKYYMKEKKIRNNSKLFDFYRDINRTSVPLFFDNLTHLEKTIIEYRVYDNLSFAEISQKIMMPKSSVYRYYNKAINKLKKDDSSN